MVEPTNWRRKVILVTGGAGLVGSRIVKKLVQRGATVRVLDNLSAYPFDQLAHFEIKDADGVEFIKGDLTSREVVDQALKDINIVFHEAAFADVAASIWNPYEDFHSNVCGTFNLLNSARNHNVDRFIFASSASVYGDKPRGEDDAPPIFSESSKPDPISTYANSKLWGEHECLLFHNLYGLKTTSLRYFSIYGASQVPKKGSHSWVVAIFTMKLLQGKPLTIFGDGSQIRDFIHVEDVAEATILASEKQSTIGGVINIGTGRPTSIIELAKTLTEIVGTKTPYEFKPRPKGDPLGGYADTRLMKEALDWTPKITLDEGIRGYWRWARSNPVVIPDWL